MRDPTNGAAHREDPSADPTGKSRCRSSATRAASTLGGCPVSSVTAANTARNDGRPRTRSAKRWRADRRQDTGGGQPRYCLTASQPRGDRGAWIRDHAGLGQQGRDPAGHAAMQRPAQRRQSGQQAAGQRRAGRGHHAHRNADASVHGPRTSPARGGSDPRPHHVSRPSPSSREWARRRGGRRRPPRRGAAPTRRPAARPACCEPRCRIRSSRRPEAGSVRSADRPRPRCKWMPSAPERRGFPTGSRRFPQGSRCPTGAPRRDRGSVELHRRWR